MSSLCTLSRRIIKYKFIVYVILTAYGIESSWDNIIPEVERLRWVYICFEIFYEHFVFFVENWIQLFYKLYVERVRYYATVFSPFVHWKTVNTTIIITYREKKNVLSISTFSYWFSKMWTVQYDDIHKKKFKYQNNDTTENSTTSDGYKHCSVSRRNSVSIASWKIVFTIRRRQFQVKDTYNQCIKYSKPDIAPTEWWSSDFCILTLTFDRCC